MFRARQAKSSRDAGVTAGAGASPAGDVSPGGGGAASSAELIPGWLALLVLVLLLAVAALGGYLIRGALTAPKPETPAEYAVRDWEKKAADNPEDAGTLLSLGYAYQIEGRYEEALKSYDKVLSLDATNSGALYNKGVVLMETGKAKEAEAIFWKVLKDTPDHVLAAKALGEYYVGKKQYKSALVALEPVIELRPEYADLQYLAGYSCEQLGITQTAIRYYRGALTYNPDYPEARDGLARLGAAEQTP